MKVAQIRMGKIKFHMICAVYTVMKKEEDLSHVRAKKKERKAPCACSLYEE